MALIMAMMIVVLVTSVVVATSWRYEVGMSRNENRWHGTQARLVMEGGEQLVIKLLLDEDLRDPSVDGNADHLFDIWAQPQQMPIDNGYIEVKIEDAQARFNINLLALPNLQATPPGQPPSPQQPLTPQQQQCQTQPEAFECKYTEPQRIFIRLLQLIMPEQNPLSLQDAEEITQAVIDWVDADQTFSIPNGAEQSAYVSNELPIVVSNRPMASITELSLVKGMTPDLYERLLPYVIALPADGPMAAYLNVNTAPDILLRALNARFQAQPLELEQAAELVNLRNEKVRQDLEPPGQGFQDANAKDFVGEVVSELALVTDPADFDGNFLVTGSRYFIYSATVTLGDKVRRGKSLIRRINNTHEVIWRTDGNF